MLKHIGFCAWNGSKHALLDPQPESQLVGNIEDEAPVGEEEEVPPGDEEAVEAEFAARHGALYDLYEYDRDQFPSGVVTDKTKRDVVMLEEDLDFKEDDDGDVDRDEAHS